MHHRADARRGARMALTVTGAGGLALVVGVPLLDHVVGSYDPPALALTLGAWCVSLAAVLYFSQLGGAPALRALALVALLSITVPVSTLLLARTGLFRKRQAGEPAPPPLR